MQTFRSAIYIACIVGLVSSAVGAAAPRGTISKYLTPIMACILLLACASPFCEDGFKLDVPDYETQQSDITDPALERLSEQCYLSAARREIADYFNGEFEKAGFKNVHTVISVSLDEYNDIVITKVSVIGAKPGDKDRLRDKVSAVLPDCEIVFENSGADNDEE